VVFTDAVFLAATFLTAAVLTGVLAGALAAALAAPAVAVLRGGNFEVRGSNSKFTLPAVASQARKALKARRVLLETNLSSSWVLPDSSSRRICSRTTGCCRITLPLLKLQLGVGWAAVGTAFSQT